MPPRGQIRPSDQARENAVRALRAHYAAGRLDEPELERRVERAYAAQTRDDLKALFRDLPWDPPARERGRRFIEFQRTALRADAVAYAGVNGMLVGIWALTGGGAFWPGWSLGLWGAFLGAHWGAVRTLRKTAQTRGSLPRGRSRRIGPG